MSSKSPNKKNKRKQISIIIKDRFESSSILALSSFIKNENWIIKLTWLVFLLGSAGVCGWFISRSINDYLNYNVITKTIIKNVNKMNYPIISICNLNPFATNYATQKIYSLFPSYLINKYGTVLDGLVKIVMHSSGDKLEKFQLGFSLNNTIYSCLYNSKSCDLNQDFEQYYDINYGNCFRFNSGKSMNGSSTSPKYIFASGLLSAFNVELFIGAAYSNENIYSIENGFNIFISDEKKDSTRSEGIRISPGMSTYIVLDKYSIKKQPNPYSECISDLTTINSYSSTCYQRVFSPDRKYHFTDCSNMCFQKLVGDNCGCQTTYFNYVYYSNMRICSKNESLVNDLNCLIINWMKFSDTQSILEECDCPLECEYTGYNFRISSSEYPTLAYYNNYLTNVSVIRSRFSNQSEINFENVKKSVAKLTIFYDELKQTFINEEVKTEVFDLVSSVGGFLGLFLGISCLSLIEILEILIKIVCLFYDFFIKEKVKKPKVNTTEQY